jgi:anti-sigma factor ChrR (cupin superfamily)
VKHARLTDTLRDRASLYALGSLPEDDAREFGAHLDGCDICREEVRASSSVACDLALAPTAVPPRPELRQRLLAAIARPPTPGPGFAFVHEPEGAWTEIQTGVFQKVLARRSNTDPTAYFIRMEPGARVATHHHGSVEHCYVVEGDLHIAGRDIQAGDYHLADHGTTHDDAWSREGCLLLIVESRV